MRRSANTFQGMGLRERAPKTPFPPHIAAQRAPASRRGCAKQSRKTLFHAPVVGCWVRSDTQTGRPDKRACRVQYAFKDSMTHVLRVALIFALRYVLHRRESRVIRC